MSAPGKIQGKDVWSALRHTVLPIAAGVVLAGWQVVEATLQTGQVAVDWSSVYLAGKIAALAGVGRLVHRWATDVGK